MSKRICIRCGKPIVDVVPNQKMHPACALERKREQHREYNSKYYQKRIQDPEWREKRLEKSRESWHRRKDKGQAPT